ncbi:MAG: hypothetical protein HN509_04125 [Halobacteriovoraceae bacterium]|nr:hypothetical protein [Halobacteriovoraceae bacterium]
MREESPEWWQLLKKLALVALVLHLVTAFFSEGFHRPDEHLGIMRWMGYKLNITPEKLLSWEWPVQIRPWAQPGLYYLIVKTMNALGMDNPFYLSTVLRVFSSMTGLLAQVLLAISFERFIVSKKWKKISLYFIFLLWYLPFFHARTTSENLSTNFFIYAFFIVTILTPKELLRNLTPSLELEKKGWKLNLGHCLLVGFFLGLSFIFRYQMAVMVFFFCLWFLVIGKLRISSLFFITASFFLTQGLSALVNYWGYGEWSFPPYNYYYQNIVVGMASGFGVDPWWKYLTKSITRGIPPLSLLFVIPIFWMILKRWRHLILWTILPFFVFHSMVGHKELRFIFGLGLFSPLAAILFLEHFEKKLPTPNWLVKLVIFQNAALLIFCAFRPAYSPIKFYKHLYYKEEVVNRITTLNLIRDQMFFYQKNDIKMTYQKDYQKAVDQIDHSVQWILTDQLAHVESLRQLSYCREDYLSYPEFVVELMKTYSKRSKVWGLYRCQKI